MLRQVTAFSRPLQAVLLLVSFPRSQSPVVGVPGLCWLRRVLPPGVEPHSARCAPVRSTFRWLPSLSGPHGAGAHWKPAAADPPPNPAPRVVPSLRHGPSQGSGSPPQKSDIQF